MGHTHTRARTHTHTHTYIPWIRKCVIKTAGFGTSHNTQIYKSAVTKYYKHFTKTVL